MTQHPRGAIDPLVDTANGSRPVSPLPETPLGAGSSRDQVNERAVSEGVPRCPAGHSTVPASLSVCEGMWFCGECEMYYAPSMVTPAQPNVPYDGRPSERP